MAEIVAIGGTVRTALVLAERAESGARSLPGPGVLGRDAMSLCVTMCVADSRYVVHLLVSDLNLQCKV